MSEQERIFVHDGSQSGSPAIATVFANHRRGVLTTTFRYNDEYIASPNAWPVGPGFALGAQSVSQGLPGPLADTAPDRWGRNLIDKRIRAQWSNEDGVRIGGAHKAITEVDYLLGVSDLTRQGALRYRVAGEESFLAPDSNIPRLIDLPRLLNATERVDSGGEAEMQAIKDLLDAGSASLGGARPKASVRTANRLLLAKFPHNTDSWNVMAWEATALDLAAAVGIAVPEHRLLLVNGRSVLLLDRFDRRGSARIPFISGMTLTGKFDGEAADYVEVAEAMSENCDRVATNLRELWMRIAFSVAINNTDDHLRNIGFLHANKGWSLAPLFDVNPNPNTHTARVTSIGWQTNPTSELASLLAVAPYFGLTETTCMQMWSHIQAGIANWSQVAKSNGIVAAEIEQFAPIFESG